jgi:hypothetical protein
LPNSPNRTTVHTPDPAPLAFRKSSYSVTAQECVEVAVTSEFVAVRDSAHRELGYLTFPLAEWRAFLTELTDR